MEIPKTTKDNPYIKFSFDKRGNISYTVTNSWFGGNQGGFVSSNGVTGNTCLPEHLEQCVKAFKEKKEKEVQDKILKLKTKLAKLNKKNLMTLSCDCGDYSANECPTDCEKREENKEKVLKFIATLKKINEISKNSEMSKTRKIRRIKKLSEKILN